MLQSGLFGQEKDYGAPFVYWAVTDMLLTASTLAPAYVLRRNRMGVLHPLVMIGIVWPIIRGLPFIDQQFGSIMSLLGAQPYVAPMFTGLLGHPPRDILTWMAYHNCLSTIGLLATYGVFSMTSRVISPRLQPSAIWLQRPPVAILFLIIAVSIAGAAYFVVSQGGANLHLAALSQGRFTVLAGLGPLIALLDAGWIAALVWVASRPGAVRQPVFIGAVMIVIVTQFLINGSRSQALAVPIIVAITWMLRRGTVPWRTAVLAAPALFMAYGIMTVSRTAGWGHDTASATINRLDFAKALETARIDTAARATERGAIPVLAMGHELTGGPLLGQTYVPALLAFIPRSVWQNKPRGPGSTYARYFLGALLEGTTVPIGPVSEAYWNFGIFGVVFVFSLSGLLIGFFFNLFLRHRTNSFAVAAISIFYYQFHMVTESIVTLQQNIFVLMLIMLIVYMFKSHTRPIST